ncbi:MAG: DUF3048 domain-containing protein [Acidimicrobiia bacterium]|nr:DUF3048 domain-containing protein [Acidimicrobiia bacterium]
MRRAPAFLAFLLAAGACSGTAAETTTMATTTTTSTTTTAATTTTTSTTTTMATTTTVDPSLITILPEGQRSAVNGLAAERDAGLDRRAVAVKIDNHPDARPQSGLQEADGVIEILVEGGFTRFIAVFHGNDSEYLGPVRSLRPTDSTILPAIPAPLVISGGQPWVQGLAVRRGVKLIGEGTIGLYRISTRVAPHDLYANTTLVRQTAAARGYPDTAPTWIYRLGEWRIPETPATAVTLSWSDSTVITWKYEDGRYTRWHGTTPQEYETIDGARGKIAADVLVILAGDEYTAFPPADGTPVPETGTTGSGAAWVISRGGMWTGTWERTGITDQFRLLNADGTEAVVPAGIPWVSIFPDDRPITIS